MQPDETRAESLTGDRSKAHAPPASEAADFAVAGQALKPGMLVDRYKLIGKLGEGGFGVVFLAFHKSFPSRRYALKLIRPDRLSTPELVSRFAKEIQAMGDLDHPNVVYATDAGEWKGIQYLAMDYVDGFALDRLVDSSSLSIADACELIRQAAVGMQHVHEMGRTHRDIKPSNLMLDTNGTVRILDLGLAKLREDAESEQDQLTAAGQMMGTPDYMAPEQWEDSSTVDIRADIYSLGCSLFCLLSGQAPFSENKSAIAKMRAHTSQEPPKIAELRDGISEEVVQVVRACLEKNRDARFAEPAALAEALTPFARAADLSKLLTSSGYSVVPPEIADQSTAVKAALADSTVVATEKSVSGQNNSTPESDHTEKPSLRMQIGMQSGRSRSISFGIVAVLLIGLPVLYFVKFENVPETAPGITTAIKDGHDADQTATTDVTAPILPDDVESPLTVTHFRVDDAQVPELVGTIGEHEASILFDDVVKLKVQLERPQFVIVVALNPDGSIQLCVPDDESDKPTATNSLEFPSESDLYFSLTDGKGQQAFLVLLSEEPLPAFRELRSKLEAVGWKTNSQPGLWQFDGAQVRQMFPGRVDRGTIKRLTAETFRKASLQTTDSIPNCRVFGFAFPVE